MIPRLLSASRAPGMPACRQPSNPPGPTMHRIAHRFVPALLALLATGLALAQGDDGEPLPGVRGGPVSAGDYAGQRPPGGARPEAQRASWQKRAAERPKPQAAIR